MKLMTLRQNPWRLEINLALVLLIAFGSPWIGSGFLFPTREAAAQVPGLAPTPVLVASFQPAEGVPPQIATRLTNALLSSLEKSRRFTATRLSIDDPTIIRLIQEGQITEEAVTSQLERPTAEGLAEIAFAAKIPVALFGEVDTYTYDPANGGRVKVRLTAHFVTIDLTTGAVAATRDVTVEGTSKPQLKPTAEDTLAAQALYDASENLIAEVTGRPRPPEVKPEPKGLSGLAIVAGLVAIALIAGQQGDRRAPVRPAVAPNAPRSVRAVPFGNQINVSWLPPAAGNPSGYHIYRAEAGAATRGTSRQGVRLTIGAPVPAVTTTFADTTAVAGTLYIYAVTAIYPDGSESSQAPANVDPTGRPTPTGIGVPLPPVNFAGRPGDTVAILSWSDNPDNAPGLVAGFRLYRATNPGMTGAVMVAGESVLRAASRTFTDSGLQNGQVYYYAIEAVSILGFRSARSVVVAVTPGNLAPQAPASLTAAWDTGAGAVRLSWTASPDPDIREYKIYRKAESFTRSRAAVSRLRSPTVLPNLPPGVAQQLVRSNPSRQASVTFTEADRIATVSATSFNDTGAAAFLPRPSDSLAQYSNLFYAVRAVDTTGQESGFSPIASVTPNNPPPSLATQTPVVVPGDRKNTIVVEALLQSAETNPEWRVDKNAIRILRSTTAGGTATAPAITPVDPLPLGQLQTGPQGRFFEDTNVTNGTIYFYAVQLVDKLGVGGARSREASCTPFASAGIIFETQNNVTELSGNGSHQLPILLTARDSAGRPVAGLRIQIRIDPPGRGTVSPAEGITDRLGQFAFTYTAPVVTTDETVSLSAITGLTNVTVTPLQLTVRAPVIGSVNLSAVKAQLTADGLDSTPVTVSVLDRFGQPLPNVTVDLTVDPVGAGRLLDDAGREVDHVQVGASGVGRVVFRAATVAREVTVIAIARGTPVSDQLKLTLVAGSPANIGLSAHPREPVADGSSQVTITAEVTDSHHNPVHGARVEFESADPLLVFEATRRTTVTAVTSRGRASVTAIAPLRSGSYLVRARVGFVTATITLLFKAGPPATAVASVTNTDLLVSLTQPRYEPLRALSQAFITVLIFDTNGNPVVGETVNASTTAGGVVTSSATTDEAGRVTLLYTAPGTPVQDTVTITANGASTSVNFNIRSGPPDTITIVRSPDSLPADGSSTATVLVRVVDGRGNPVRDGIPVRFEIEQGFPDSAVLLPGNVQSLTVSTTRGDGSASVTLKAGTLPGTVRLRIFAEDVVSSISYGAERIITLEIRN
ncbi:MAG: hypothetical protein NZ959_02685 [Armatimonadetes bacterium]|nr:hypothetical protein [Armatimonadota bacterium]